MKRITLLSCLLLLAAGYFPSLEGNFPRLVGPYLGQRPPGMTPEVFAPGIVSTGLDELNSVFSPDGSEFYFCVRNIQGAASIFQMKLEKRGWTEPRLLPFASRFGDIDVSISPAGDALLFSSRRPRPGSQEPRQDNDFWFVPRKGEAWSDPVYLGSGINSDSHDYYPVMTRKEAIYFSSQREGPGKNDIFRSERTNGAYADAVKLGDAVNTEFREYDPCVSPGEDVLIFTSERPGGLGMGDLYVSFRVADGSWTQAVNMGAPVNSPGPEFCPMLSPDGKYLFFTSFRFEQGRAPEAPLGMADFIKAHNHAGNGLGDIYWVSAKVIETLRPGTPAGEAAVPAKSETGREPLVLTRIANSGVLLVSGKTKILIDALFDKPPADYRGPDPAVLDKIMKGEAPFDGVDLALVTHNHPDHFAAPLAVRFLGDNPGAMLAAPEDAVAEMRKETDWAKIATRVVPLDLKLGEQAQREIAGVSLAACRTLHSGKKEEPMNLMFRFRFNGWSIFHEGDADATLDEYRGFGLAEAEIDLALVHYWFPLHPEMAKLLQEVIRPAHIGLTHLPIRLESDAPGKIDMVRKDYRDIFLLLPGMPARTFTQEAVRPRPLRALVLLGDWFGDTYFPLQQEIAARGWDQKRVGVDAEYRGCYNKKRDVLLTSDILIPDLKDLSAYDVLIIPSGPQFRKFKENPVVLEFLKKAHASGMLIASFCVGNFLVQAAGLTDLEPPALFPDKVTLVREGLLLGPRGGGPPPGDGFKSAPIKEICDAIARELYASAPQGNSFAGLDPGTWEKARKISQKSLAIDCHSHSLLRSLLPERKTGEQMTFAMLKAAGIKGVVQALPVKKNPGVTVSENIFSDIEFVRTRISRDSLKAGIALASSDLDFMAQKGETAILIALESFDGLGQGDVGLLQKYHDQGVRAIGLFQAGADRIFEADRLTELGRNFVKELNRLGMICDITHLPTAVQEQIIAESLSPVIISHSAAFHLIQSDFNVPDSVLEKLASRGGILCLTFFSGQLANESLAQANSGAAPDRIPRARVEEFINQIDYLKKKIGIDHIGIGSDYGGSGRLAPNGLETAEGFPLIIYHLLHRGYSQSEIEKIMGANFVGLWRKVEEKSAAAGKGSRKN